MCTPSSGSADCQTFSSPQTSVDVFTFSASPDPGWVFVKWLADGSEAGSSPTITRGPFDSYFVPGESLQAVFESQQSSGNNAPIDFGEFDSDADGVINNADQCPNYWDGKTPVDAVGCTETQRDDDDDSVRNGWDRCAATPAGEVVDSEGCSDDQRDEDRDGVDNADDQCPATPESATVDSSGCAESQRDADSDGVSDSLDQCPETPSADTVDDSGCSEGQRDDDSDGIPNADDTCAATEAGSAVNDQGCSVIQEQLADLGDDLANLDGLDEDDRSLASAIDGACERLIRFESSAGGVASDTLSGGQQDLKTACRSLKSSATSSEQQLAGVVAISPQLLTNRVDAVIEAASRQFQQVTQRQNRIKSGASRGVSLAGLTLNFAGKAIPGALLEEASDQAGMSDLGPDFGNWGIYLQGDLDVTERRDTDARRQYDEDSWLSDCGR